MPLLQRSHRWLHTGDRIGATGSILCAIHCAAAPVALAMLPALGVGIAGNIDIDQGFAVFAIFLGLGMLGLGYRRHRVVRPWLYLLPGIALLVGGAFSQLHDHGLAHALTMTVGGVLVALAHMSNLHQTRAVLS